VPQERERAEDLLRYSEAAVEGKGREGEFSFEGVAPCEHSEGVAVTYAQP